MASKNAPRITGKTRPLTIDGHKYTVRVGFLAYDAMYQLTGISLFKGWGEETKWDVKEYVCFLFAGLLEYQPNIQIEDCYRMLDGENFAVVVDALFGAYKAGLPPAPKGDSPNPLKPTVK